MFECVYVCVSGGGGGGGGGACVRARRCCTVREREHVVREMAHVGVALVWPLKIK